MKGSIRERLLYSSMSHKKKLNTVNSASEIQIIGLVPNEGVALNFPLHGFKKRKEF